jgi:hypothetical protein
MTAGHSVAQRAIHPGTGLSLKPGHNNQSAVGCKMREDRVVSCGRWGDGVQAFAKRVAGAGDGLRADGEGSGGAGPSFKIADILLEDGTLIGVEGEHDFPYLVEYTISP